jgi:hypothetical protein
VEWTEDGKRKYPHMCRDGHQEIGHAGDECPVCELRAGLTLAIALAVDPQPHNPSDIDVCRKILEAARTAQQ